MAMHDCRRRSIVTYVERLQRSKRRRPSSAEEENLLLEVLEDNRLRGIGIDPDGDSVDIMVELMRRLEILEAESNRTDQPEKKPPQTAPPFFPALFLPHLTAFQVAHLTFPLAS